MVPAGLGSFSERHLKAVMGISPVLPDAVDIFKA
jgi:hypothetical protein